MSVVSCMGWSGAHSTQERLVMTKFPTRTVASHQLTAASPSGCGQGSVPGVLRTRSRDNFCDEVATHPKNVAMTAVDKRRFMSQRCGENPNFFFEFGNAMYCYAHNFAVEHLCATQPAGYNGGRIFVRKYVPVPLAPPDVRATLCERARQCRRFHKHDGCCWESFSFLYALPALRDDLRRAVAAVPVAKGNKSHGSASWVNSSLPCSHVEGVDPTAGRSYAAVYMRCGDVISRDPASFVTLTWLGRCCGSRLKP